MSLLKLMQRVDKLEAKFRREDYQSDKADEELSNKIMSLEDQIKKLEDQLIKESQFRNADYQLIEKLDKRIRDLELKLPKKRGRGRPAKKLTSEDFD